MPGEMEDKQLTCVDCGMEFTFTARDQGFYQERGYQAPRRCKTCRDKRKGSASAGAAHSRGFDASHRHADISDGTQSPKIEVAEQFKVNCSTCGVETMVPFKPDPSRPVYCRSCFLKHRKAAGHG